jgi:hypothetical protein
MAAGYDGLFLRHFMGDAPGAGGAGQGMSDSPDIILPGDTPVDPAALVTPLSYGTELGDTLLVGPGVVNYVYVRGLNATAGALAARLWLWYVDADALQWPQKWMSQGIYVDGVAQNWVVASAQNPDQIVVGDAFAGVSLPAPRDHYCMVAIAENPPLSQPAAPPLPGDFPTLDDFEAWVEQNPNVAWRDAVSQPGSPATWTWVTQISGPPKAGPLMLGVACRDMPVGSRFRFVVPAGTTPDGSPFAGCDSGPMPIADPNETFFLPISWPAGVLAGMTVYWWADGTSPPEGASISPAVTVPAPSEDAS